jgi:SAM-dependent methyltransferase
MDIRHFLRKLRTRVLPNLKYLPQSRVRTCGCCRRLSFIVSLSAGDEFKICVRCRANLRYELLATCLRATFPSLAECDVVELDPCSPLRRWLAVPRSYTRTYYSASDPPGSIRADGARCEDVTRLTFPDNSVDLLISSDVLEHVPDVAAAFRETRRVLRPGGVHLFTVPTVAETAKRAEILAGRVRHLLSPEYHSDPLNPEGGILAFWTFGRDMGEVFTLPGLTISIAAGPAGRDGRIVWKAQKSE